MAFGSLPSVLGSGGGTAYSLIGGTGLFADGTAAAPSISFASQTNKGFYSRSSNQIGVSIAGTDSLVFTSGGGLQGTSSNGVIFNSSGGALLFAGGVNQNITLTPSGTGVVSVSGPLQLSNAYAAGVVAPTGTIIIKDSTGTSYRVACAL